MKSVRNVLYGIILFLCFSLPLEAGQAEPVTTAQPVIEQQTAAEAKPAGAKPAVKPNRFKASWWALLPPLLAIVLALITKDVYSSLFAGILLGGCFAARFMPLKVMDTVIRKGFIEAVSATAGIFIFLVILGIIVAMINRTGAAAAFGRWAKTHIKTRAGAILATLLLGVLIFIDDYFNCLTVGSVMRPVTDAKRISRAKLAYVIDSTAAPVCMIAPISSWAAAVSQYADGAKCSGLELFIRAIPYNFYSLLTLIFIVAVTLLKIDYGPMLKYEVKALTRRKRPGGEPKTEDDLQPGRGAVRDMLIPVILLIGLCIFGLVYAGGIFEGKSFAAAFSGTDAGVALPWGALPALIISIVYLTWRRTITWKDAMECIPKGFCAMVPAILILTFATVLKNMTGLLEAREFIAVQMGQAAPSLAQFLPAVIFLTAIVLAFSTGTSWGTFGILIPIVVEIFPAGSPLLYIGMSACLAGAVCGDHCSPISDTTIMSAAGAGCDLIQHTSTQLPYALTTAFFSFIGFVLAGVIRNWYIVFPITVILMLGLLVFFKLFAQSRSKPVRFLS